MSDFAAHCREVLDRARRAGWSVQSERAIPYGRLYVLETPGVAATATLSCYQGKKGFSLVVGGKRREDLGADLGAPAPESGSPVAAGDDPFGAGTPRVGADESGKGDYFGPLVVAAWYLDVDEVAALRRLGVADSKALGDGRVERIAGQLDALGHGAVLSLMPRDYNRRYAEVGNLNVLLAEMHAACIRGLLDRAPGRTQAVVVDQFARDGSVLARALGLPPGCRLVTRTKGEADPAVAAASLLARAEFLRGLRALGHEFGHDFAPGAGEPTLRSARAFVASFGKERLGEVAKVHFATTRRL
jgi:ribonuclease HIII